MADKEAARHNFTRVNEIIEKHGKDQSKLIPILQEVQKEYRYLPEEILTYIATVMDLSPATVYGVATFYAQFSLDPKGKYVINVCDGTACHVSGSLPVLNAIRKKLNLEDGKFTTDDLMFTVETVSCLGACGLAPVVTINGKVYGKMTPEAIEVIIDELMGRDTDDQE
ncbi:NADH-quinone oxidoreductase subunit NuoE [Halothermothrix orenii]|uniref:NADH dehydrogenase I subunit E n=1 Tax=Halothermothrix orenii (strain H 168 / OCM 544 / DSM 9562) TaxID=373903 RepID=B8D0X2_HALOH|nr:NADH-quinone oxidoreductase subunit NuoE [Halothermothrix orenii]ACL68941.1 NADH dehydrogenase I subunit E [Halothermothrix orenii H 168]